MEEGWRCGQVVWWGGELRDAAGGGGRELCDQLRRMHACREPLGMSYACTLFWGVCGVHGETAGGVAGAAAWCLPGVCTGDTLLEGTQQVVLVRQRRLPGRCWMLTMEEVPHSRAAWQVWAGDMSSWAHVHDHMHSRSGWGAEAAGRVAKRRWLLLVCLRPRRQADAPVHSKAVVSHAVKAAAGAVCAPAACHICVHAWASACWAPACWEAQRVPNLPGSAAGGHLLCRA